MTSAAGWSPHSSYKIINTILALIRLPRLADYQSPALKGNGRLEELIWGNNLDIITTGERRNVFTNGQEYMYIFLLKV